MNSSAPSSDDSRLEALRQAFEHEASFNQVFVVLTVLLVLPLGNSFLRLQQQARREHRAYQLQATIEQQLRRNTITLGSDPAVELMDLSIDWQANPPLIRARVRVTDPQLPTQAQVAAVQEFINRRQSPRRYRLLVQRTAVDLIGPETAPNPAAAPL